MNRANYRGIRNSQDPIFHDPGLWLVGECQARQANFRQSCAANGSSASTAPDPSFTAVTTDARVLALAEPGCTVEQIHAVVEVYAGKDPGPTDGHFAHLLAGALQRLPEGGLEQGNLQRLISLVKQAAWDWGSNKKLQTWHWYERVISEVNLPLFDEYLLWLWRDKGFRAERKCDIGWSQGMLPLAMTLPKGCFNPEIAARVRAFLTNPLTLPPSAPAASVQE